MAKKYSIKKGYEDKEICTRNPSAYKRAKGGRFILSECSQADLKYLHDVIGYKGVEINEQPRSKEDTGASES